MSTPNETSDFRRKAVTLALVAGTLLGAAGVASAATGAQAADDTNNNAATAEDNTTTDAPAADNSRSSSTEGNTSKADDTNTDSSGAARSKPADDGGDRGQPNSTEELLTGDLADQVSAAALEAVPGGTIERVETDDGDAAYEAHMTNADGERVTALFDENITLIDVTEGCGQGGPDGDHMDGGRGRGQRDDGTGSDRAPSTDQSSSSNQSSSDDAS